MSNSPINQKPYSEIAFTFLRQCILTLFLHKTAWEFITEHRPWKGLKQHRWMTGVVILAAIILGWQFFRQIWDMLAAVKNDQQVMSAGMATIFENFSFEKVEWVMHGGKKYLVLVVLEIIIFHIVRQVLQIRTGLKSDSSFQAFIEAEIRMIKVSFFAWVMESIVRGVFNLGLGILGLDALKFPIGLAVQFYFLGYSLIDNYMECYGWKNQGQRKIHTAGCRCRGCDGHGGLPAHVRALGGGSYCHYVGSCDCNAGYGTLCAGSGFAGSIDK